MYLECICFFKRLGATKQFSVMSTRPTKEGKSTDVACLIDRCVGPFSGNSDVRLTVDVVFVHVCCGCRSKM